MSSKLIAGIAIVVILAGAAIFIVYSNPALKEKVSSLVGQKKVEKKKIVVTKEKVNKLVKENMQNFALSVNQKDMSAFYSTLSPYWQKRTSVEELNKTFDPFIKAGVDLTPLKDLKPIIDKGTKVTDKKDLHIVGHYDTKPSVVRFKQTYQYQKNKGWKLVEFFVEIK